MTKETQSSMHLAPVVQRVDNAIHWINRYRVHTSEYVLSTLIRWMVIYPLDSIIRPLNYLPLQYFQENHSVIVHALLGVKKT